MFIYIWFWSMLRLLVFKLFRKSTIMMIPTICISKQLNRYLPLFWPLNQKIIVLVGCISKSKRKTHFGGDNKCSIKWHCVHHTRFHTRTITYKYLLILFALIRFFKLRIFCVLSLPENHLLWTPLLVIVKIEQKHWKYQPCASACDGNNFFIKSLQDNDKILI